MTFEAPPSDLVDRLVYANRILYDQGIVDGLGHVSVRHPTKTVCFCCHATERLVWSNDKTSCATTWTAMPSLKPPNGLI